MTTATATPTTVPPDAIDDLPQRLARTRWPATLDESAAVGGISVAETRRLADRWRTGFDWPALEAELDRLGQWTARTPDGRRLHTIHARSAEPTGLPILLVHGWPDSPLRFRHLIPRLTAAGHDVVAPAIPGFGFSDQPAGEMSPELAAEDFARLMSELGYDRYAVHGGDWGSAIGTALATAHPESVVALHLTEVPYDKVFLVDRAGASPVELAYLDAAVAWAGRQTYLNANMENPDTIALALSDSPVGLLAWIAEMYASWSEEPVADDDILANVALLWFTNTYRSSVRLYSEPASSWAVAGDSTEDTGEGGDWGGGDWGAARLEVPTALAVFPADIGVPPREFAERFFAVERFTVMPKGGHFAALEQPDLLADDLLEFLAGRA